MFPDYVCVVSPCNGLKANPALAGVKVPNGLKTVAPAFSNQLTKVMMLPLARCGRLAVRTAPLNLIPCKPLTIALNASCKRTAPISPLIKNETIMSDKPNILVICLDQIRQDWFSMHGHPLVRTHIWTPSVALALALIARSNVPTCIPARQTIMTGLDPWGINMFCNVGNQPFPEGKPKLAELLSDAGYHTGAFGKLHCYPERTVSASTAKSMRNTASSAMVNHTITNSI